MNIIQKLTIRHLKENKRRSLVTIIGVIISVAMITAVSTLGASFLDLMVRQEISRNGEWHVKYHNATKEQIKAIEEDSSTEKLVISTDGYAHLEGSANPYKPYLFFKNYNKAGREQFPIKVTEGRLPNSNKEIAISESIAENAKVDYQIGEEITVEIGERRSKADNSPLSQTYSLMRGEDTLEEELVINETKTLTVVGMIESPSWEPAWSPGYTVIGYVDEQSLSETDKADAIVVLSELNHSLYKQTRALADQTGIKTVDYNSELLRYYGLTQNDGLRKTLFSLAAIIMTVIIIGSVALIYNAFAISVSERARHLGMLSSVGATKKQKRNSVFFEGAVIGALSIPVGILSGLAGIAITFAFINTFIEDALGISEKLELIVTPASILIACGVSILTIFISTFLPALKASKITAIDAIRQTHDIKLSGKTVKTSKLVRKMFGLEAEIGLKNMKRNKKRYLSTLFSLVISIVLFLSVSYFTDSIKKSLDMSQNDYQFDIQIAGIHSAKEDLAAYTKLDYVTDSTLIEEVNLETFIETEELPERLKNHIQEDDSVLQDGKYRYSVMVHALDEESFDAYAEEIGANPADFKQKDAPAGIVIDLISYEDGETGKIIETKAIETEVGQKIDLWTMPYGDFENEEPERDLVGSVKISALTDQFPIGVQTAGPGGLNLIIPEGAIKQMKIDPESVSSYVYLNTSDPIATQEAIEEQKDLSVSVYNVHKQRQQQEQMILLMSVFIYGFITLISLISIANIFNTISTSISLRKREFAMLRSVGMTPKGFNKMIYFESIFYGIKALAYGLPLSVLVMFGIHYSAGHTFEYGFTLPWISILFVTIVIFVIVGSAMLYSISKIKNENIIESLRQENI